MSEFFTLSGLVATFASAVRLAVPYLLAALGETIGQRSGVLNLGVDGVMLLSAFGAYYTVLQTESHTLGVLVGLLVGLVMGVGRDCSTSHWNQNGARHGRSRLYWQLRGRRVVGARRPRRDY